MKRSLLKLNIYFNISNLAKDEKAGNGVQFPNKPDSKVVNRPDSEVASLDYTF